MSEIWGDATVISSAYEQQVNEKGQWRWRPRFKNKEQQGVWAPGPAPDVMRYRRADKPDGYDKNFWDLEYVER